MKLISLNIWGGKEFKPLMKFLRKMAGKIDIFCLQEVIFGSEPAFTRINKARINVFSEVASALKGFSSYRYLAKEKSRFGGEPLPAGVRIGQAIFVKEGIEVLSHGGIRTYRADSSIAKNPTLTICGNLEYLKIRELGRDFVVVNLHGIWQEGTHKMDTSERIEQSKKIMEFLDEKKGGKILIGDFNLRPDTKSMKILEEGMRNLIAEHNITSTRSPLYEKEVKFSDYALISPDVWVKKFSVLSGAVSDHLPLLLDFS